MAENKGRGSTSIGAIWVALIGALASSGGYLFAYYKDLSMQENKQRHDLILKLMREDPRETSDNLIWAHEARLIQLEVDTVKKLNDNPLSAPTRSEQTQASDVRVEDLVPASDVVALARGLDGPTKTARSQALQVLLDKHRTNSEAIRSAIDMLSNNRHSELTVNGRYNVIYYLNELDWKIVEQNLRSEVQKTIEDIQKDSNEGLVAIGPKTQALLDDLSKNLKV